MKQKTNYGKINEMKVNFLENISRLDKLSQTGQEEKKREITIISNESVSLLSLQTLKGQ